MTPLQARALFRRNTLNVLILLFGVALIGSATWVEIGRKCQATDPCTTFFRNGASTPSILAKAYLTYTLSGNTQRLTDMAYNSSYQRDTKRAYIDRQVSSVVLRGSTQFDVRVIPSSEADYIMTVQIYAVNTSEAVNEVEVRRVGSRVFGDRWYLVAGSM